jgi:hypothetical protein
MTEYIDSARTAPATRFGEINAAVLYLGRRLLGSRLLLAYVVLGIASGLAGGAYGLSQAAVNYLVLLPLYTLVIYIWTRGDTTLANAVQAGTSPGRNRGITRDLSLVGLLFGFNFAVTAWFWAGGLPAAVAGDAYRLVQGAGWDPELTRTVASGLTQTLLQLLPAALILFAVFRLSPRQIALVPRRLGLGLVLAPIGIAVAALLKWPLGITPTPLFRGLELVPQPPPRHCPGGRALHGHARPLPRRPAGWLALVDADPTDPPTTADGADLGLSVLPDALHLAGRAVAHLFHDSRGALPGWIEAGGSCVRPEPPAPVESSGSRRPVCRPGSREQRLPGLNLPKHPGDLIAQLALRYRSHARSAAHFLRQDVPSLAVSRTGEASGRLHRTILRDACPFRR